MSISSEERQAIRDSFARLLSQQCTESHIRELINTTDGYDPELWRKIADMGLVGLLVDEEYGGSGAGAAELEYLMEEAGAALLPGPFLSSGVLAASLLTSCSDDSLKRRFLPALAAGTNIATVALTGDVGSWTPQGVEVEAAQVEEAWTLNGIASFVTWARSAETLLVVAKVADEPSVFVVEGRRKAPVISDLETFDPTLRLLRMSFDDVDAIRLDGVDGNCIEKAMNLARVALAGEQVGAARRVLDGTVDYIKTRMQFGRAIGGFQAIKHMAADLLLGVESATSAAREAARAVAEDDPRTEELVSLAAFACADTFVQMTASAIQMHGGIGFTWDHWAHLYWRRARADAQLFGSADFYRERYLAAKERQLDQR